jgi:hypothetical protein
LLPPSKPGAPKNLTDTPRGNVPLGVRLPKGAIVQNAQINNCNLGICTAFPVAIRGIDARPFIPSCQAAPSFPIVFINVNVAGWVLTARLSANSLRYSLFVTDHPQGRARGPALLANAIARKQQAASPVARAAIAANNHAMPRLLKRHLKTYGTSINSSRTASCRPKGAEG